MSARTTRTGDVLFPGRTVANNYYFFQILKVFLHHHVQYIAGGDNVLCDKTNIRKGERGVRAAHLQGEFTVCVSDCTVGSNTFLHNIRPNYRFARLVDDRARDSGLTLLQFERFLRIASAHRPYPRHLEKSGQRHNIYKFF
jgi:hypothetical protein